MARARAGCLMIRPRRPVCPLYPHRVKNIEQLLTALAFTRNPGPAVYVVKLPVPECCYYLRGLKETGNQFHVATLSGLASVYTCTQVSML